MLTLMEANNICFAMTVNLRERIIKALNVVLAGHAEITASTQVDDAGGVIVTLEVDPAQGPKLEPFRQQVEATLAKIEGVNKASVILTAQKQKPTSTPDPHGMNKNPPIDVPARQIIVVASGKGGVGKSTVAANIAAALGRRFSVGLLDADIYGPSQPTMMGEVGFKPALNARKQFEPLRKHGLKIMSIGFLVEAGKALVWRGPMVQTAVYQMLRDVAWANEDGSPLDYLIIDMPPGTGDVQLTIAQKVRATGAVIVSTPQDIALIDARRAVEMFHKTGVPILGLIENMSVHICSNCGHSEPIFGQGGAEEEAKNLSVPFLGKVPLAKSIREQSDAGIPIVIAQPDGLFAKAYAEITEKITVAPA